MNDQRTQKFQTMLSSKDSPKMGFAEFITLAAAMQSMTALSIDAMLPALPSIAADLNAVHANDVQLVVLVMMMGFGIGQILYGTISDSTGRKPPIYTGIGVYIVGCLICITSDSLKIMLAGRFLQGLGVAGPRIVMNAVIRDHFEGPGLARVMSIVMAVFILVPVIAPAVGQGVLLVFNWRAIFLMFLLIALIVLVWFSARLTETLTPEKRKSFSFRNTYEAIAEIVKTRNSLGYTMAIGFILSPFMGYLSSAQQIFAEVFGMEEEFPLLFASLALSIGAAFLVNARLVYKYGTRALSFWSVTVITILSFVFWTGLKVSDLELELWVFMPYMVLVFLCIGFLFGNLNALALEPLGHIAGAGAAVIGFLSSLVSIPLGIVIGQAFNGTVLPLVSGFAVCGSAVILSILWAEKGLSPLKL